MPHASGHANHEEQLPDGVLAPVWSADMRDRVGHSLPVPGFMVETSAMEREQMVRGTSVPGKSSGNGVLVG